MLHFDSDYMEGAHPEILRRLTETNLEQTPGYGSDRYTAVSYTHLDVYKRQAASTSFSTGICTASSSGMAWRLALYPS